MNLEITPLTPVIGAEVTGIDLANDLDDPDVFQALHRAFLDHHVLVFRDQALDREAHKTLGRRFGELHVHPSRRAPDFPGDPEIFTVRADETSGFNNGGLWHADVTCDEIPPLGSMLRLLEAPATGGDTVFASMHAAWELLSPPIQELVAPLRAVHDQRHDLGYYDIEIPPDRELPRSSHPVVVAHPETGRPVLYVNRAFTTHIEGVTELESTMLLELLCRVVETPSIQCRVQWEPDTIVFWDNRCVQHYAVWDYRPQRRVGERVTIAGTERPRPAFP